MDVFDWKKWILSDVKTICICWLKTHCFRCGFIKNLSPFSYQKKKIYHLFTWCELTELAVYCLIFFLGKKKKRVLFDQL
jgi:hypothetical protein